MTLDEPTGALWLQVNLQLYCSARLYSGLLLCYRAPLSWRLEPSSMFKSTSTSEAPWRDAMLRTGDDLPPYLMAGGPDTG
ncbi:hypothetical protein CFAM422_010024 [Trichoderma lentiforme]|uniref:Uncharacterized protein n=1 Tax=Trichoderma lentiforme TaxID=1567552 RepID=A0A9P4X8I4_9HYPO|nr:hypothetical protein CFAM422_010024 [Trichoderma lentiforme]